MNTLVIYDSSYGNTERIARAVAEALSEHGEARVVSAAEVGTLSKAGLDLLVVGAPTQRHGLPAQVKDLLESTPNGTLEHLRALSFDTRYHHAKLITGSAAKEIGKLLRGQGHSDWCVGQPLPEWQGAGDEEAAIKKAPE